ncbi:MAG: serine hydrolase domain-containing protein [Ignavibacteria bacterium]
MKSQYKLLSIISDVLIISFSRCTENQTTPEPGNGKYVELNSLLRIGSTPGATLAIIRNFQIDTIITYGSKNFSTQDPVTRQTMFQAASISKPVTAFAVMKMVQDGLISLDENVNDKLTSWQVPENTFTVIEKVTVKHLLSHRAGMPQGGKIGVLPGDTYPSLLQILNGEGDYLLCEPQSIPGTNFLYSNEGYCVIQQLIIDVTGQSFEEYLYNTALAPLRMTSSTFEQHLSAEFQTRTVTGHFGGYTPMLYGYQLHPKLAARGLWSTSEDLAKFMIEFLQSVKGESNIVLNQNIITQMVEPITHYTDHLDYGMGMGIAYFGGETYYWHSGGFDGTHCVMYGHESAGVGLVLMTNYCDLDPWDPVIELIVRIENWPGFEEE